MVSAAALVAMCWLLHVLTWRPDVDTIVAELVKYSLDDGARLYARDCGCHQGGYAPRLAQAVREARGSPAGVRYLVESIVHPERVARPPHEREPMPYFAWSEQEVGNVTRFLVERFDLEGR